MATSISRTSALLTANSDGFTAAYAAAEKAQSSFAKNAGAVASGMAVYEVGKQALTGAYNATVGLVKAGLESADVASKQARTLGVTTEALTRLQYAASFAGVSNDALGTSLKKMLQNLGDAAGGNATAAQAFTRLGLSVEELRSMSPDQALGVIGDKLAGIQDPAVRAAAAADIFGKQWADMMPLLAGGSAELARLGQESDRTGNTVSTLGGLKIEAANDAMDRLSKLATGLGQTLAVELAPYITAAADALFEMATEGGSMGERVTAGLEMVAGGIAFAADLLELGRAGFNLLQAGAAFSIADLLTNLGLLGKSLQDVINLIPGMNVTFASDLGAMGAALKDEARKQVEEAGEAYNNFAEGKNAQAVGRFFEGVRQSANAAAEAASKPGAAVTQVAAGVDKAAQQVEGTLAKLRESVGTFGMDKAQKAYQDVITAGGSAEQAAEAARLTEELQGLEEKKKAHEAAEQAAKSYYESTRTPQEKYAAEIEKINELLLSGALDPETAQRAADAARAALGDATKPPDPGTREAPKLLQAGSAAAASFIAQIQRQQRGDSANDPARLALKKQDQANSTLDRIARAVEKEPQFAEV